MEKDEQWHVACRALLRIQSLTFVPFSSCFVFFFSFFDSCRKTLCGSGSGLRGHSRTAAVLNTKWHSAAVGLACPFGQHPHHHRRPSIRVVTVSCSSVTLVLAVVGVAESCASAARSQNKNDLHHVSCWSSKVNDAAQTPKIGSAGRQNCSFSRQCSHW